MAHLHEVRDMDTHFVIDPITRAITNPNSAKNKLMQGDHNSEIYTFEIPKMVEGHDMSLCNQIRIHYNDIASDKANESKDVYTVEDMQIDMVEADKISFSWLISGNATKYAGLLSFRIQFLCIDESGSITYKWHTEIFKGITVSDGFDNTEAAIEEYSDVIAAWEVRLDALEQGGGTVTDEPADNDIPKVFFGGALQQTKDEKVVPFRYISKTEDISGYAEIKAQGNSSMSYPKKNQTVKLFKDAACEEKLKVDFKGWGKQNKHCYKANWIDITHARNVVSARLWADVVKTRANYAELPELFRITPNQGAVDGFPVKVYAAGVYQGRYTLNIPKDKWSFNMDDGLDEHCVLCSENYVSGCFRATANINESDWTDEIHDTVPASIKTRWNEVISFVMNSTDEEFKANLGNYFYVDSLIDYDLFGLASCGLDAFGKNQIYATYDGQRWIASMYDMDSTWGLYWNGGNIVATDYARTSYEDRVNSRQGNLLYIRLEQLFGVELQSRWAELKNDALSIDNIINRFERFTDIAPADLVKEDYASTTGGGKFTGIPSKDTSNIQQIRAFAVARQAWTDEYVSALTGGSEQPDPDIPDNPEPTDVPCTGISLDKTELVFTGLGTQTITATVTPSDTTDAVVWESSNADIASVENGVVTAKNSGNVTITATCGSYSANCSVLVSGIGVETITTMLRENYSPNGEKWVDTSAIDFNAGDYVEASIDVTTCTNDKEHLLSVGANIASFRDNSAPTAHVYHRTDSTVDTYLFDGGSSSINNYLRNLSVAGTRIIVRFDADGLTVNGQNTGFVSNDAKWKALTEIQIGSQEGSVRSKATYEYIKVVRHQ